MSTESQLLAEMKPALRAALGERFSPEYVAGFVRRNRVRMESMLAPIVAAGTAAARQAESAAPTDQEEIQSHVRGIRMRSAALSLASQRVKVAANSIADLRHQDVERVLQETPSAERRKVAYVLADRRPDLSSEIDEVMREVLGDSENWSEYGRQEINDPDARVKREALAAEEAAERFRLGNFKDLSPVPLPVADSHFFTVSAIPGTFPTAQTAIDAWKAEKRPVPAGSSVWLSEHNSPSGDVPTKTLSPCMSHTRNVWLDSQDSRPSDGVPEIEWGGGLEIAGTADSLTKTLDAMLPMIEEEERRDEGPKPVVMASLEAGGVVLLSPHGFLGADLFKTYRDATARLQYVSYPKKGQRGTPSTVASAVLALERDGFEVRAATPEVVKSLIVTGGLDHALALGLPPPPEAGARPSYRTNDSLLIARVQAMAEDPPTSAIKYLVKNLRERGDLPLQVNDWKNGGKRSVETAIEEGEQKVARKLARKPKAERLRADGGERPANGPNEEHAAQALIQLANMDPDKAREVNDEGFSKSDVATGHALARRWEATGELTGDEWEWAVSVANKYRRQVGPLPEPRSGAKRQRPKTGGSRAEDRLFVGVMPTGIAYADRSREVDGDYARCAFLPFSTLALEVAPKCPKELLGLIEADAAAIIARRGEKFEISTSGHTVVLGSTIGEMRGEVQEPTKREHASSDMNYAGDSLATIHDVVSSLRRILGKIYEGYKLNIGVSRSIGDNSVMLSFYRVPPNASDLDASNAESKVRIVIHGEGRTNSPTWPTDQTPERLTAYTVWEHNAPKLRKRSGPPSVIVAAVANWFVLNSATLTSGEGPVPVHYLECPKCEANFKVHKNVTTVPVHKCWAKDKEEAAMGVALRAERDREESAWDAAVERGIAAESVGGMSVEDARRTAIANLAGDIEFYAKRNEEKWGHRP